ncbi:SGNH/GDSL hydrolase family protein [Jidongwangia harbinensis]|uniref:SGNH/GDSL hydrolase family protein n=1 Tax=Jidongwangia harbinensis TaxID=2878561 RepID=UPI001CDA14EE|nr:GDSL-type esterase/lipase family protein [Jidongwangia harbinensis]MCA2216018.1 GDSL-type esterase/lipase family protein [Jidongwangia harbinensis]
MRRWHLVCFALLAALALACEGSGAATPDRTSRPKPGYPASMAALGDSITAGIGSCLTLVACSRNSWSTGSSVDSHYRRIRAANNSIKGNNDNYAVPGARAESLAGQADRAVRAKAKYVTVMIGVNDACTDRVDDMTSVRAFRGDIDAGLARLKKRLPKSRILVVSVPDVYRLWELGKENERAVRVWRRGVCQSLLANPTSTADADDERRKRVRDRLDAYNKQLQQACKSYGRRCRWDGGAVHSVRFKLDLVSKLDYFHPNAEGQKRIADVTYPGRFTW